MGRPPVARLISSADPNHLVPGRLNMPAARHGELLQCFCGASCGLRRGRVQGKYRMAVASGCQS